MSKRKKIVFVLFAVIVLVCGTGAVMAYFADGDKAVNAFSVGHNTIVPKEEFEKPVPGKKTVKSPLAVNTGTVSCYVRAKVLLSDSRAEPYITYYNGEKKEMNMEDWKKGEEGWLYYKGILKPEEETTAVFTHIKLEQEIPEPVKEVSIDVVFESVQSQGFKDAESAFASIDGSRRGENDEKK